MGEKVGEVDKIVFRVSLGKFRFYFEGYRELWKD